jgi:hypothetical protein
MAHALLLTVLTLAGGFPVTPSTWPVAFPYDDGSWQKPLSEKEGILRQMIADRHDIEGLYPSMVTVIDGQANHTTTGHADVSHSVHWTSQLLVGEIFRWKLTGDPADFERVREVFDAVDRCQRVNGIPGLISRGYVYGHGPTYEERRGHGRGQDKWMQGEGEYERFRWRGSPSHHNHSMFFRAMGIAWTMTDDPEIRAKVKENVEQVIRRVYIENEMRVPDYDGEITAVLTSRRGADRPSMRMLFVTSALKLGAEVMQDPEVASLYDEYVGQLRYREFAHKPAEELAALIHKDWDDGEQSFHHLHTMMLLEKDEELLAFYRNFAEALWIKHRDDRQAMFNLLYHLVTGNDPLAMDVLWWMRHYPTNKFFQPRMLSHRADKDQFDLPLPLSQRPFDNEYDFKGDPYRLDGWASRFVTGVSVSPADPKVVFACDDEGFLYRSLDGGATWAESFAGLGGAKVRAVLAPPVKLEIVLAATDRGVYHSRDGGYSWSHVAGSDATALALDPADTGVAYAVADGAVWESVSYNDDLSFGQTWRGSGGDGPPGTVARLFLVADPKAGMRFYAQDDRNTVWGSQPGAEAWENLSRPFGGRYTFSGMSGSGGNLAAITPGASAVAFSPDGGRTWEPRGSSIYWYGQDAGLTGLDLRHVVIDSSNPEILYVAATDSFWVSRDAGSNWERAETGMDITVTDGLVACPVTGRVFAGTRGGLVWTDDEARTWQRGNLVPQFHGLQQIETGPADYVITYWLARYLGVLTQQQADAPWPG